MCIEGCVWAVVHAVPSSECGNTHCRAFSALQCDDGNIDNSHGGGSLVEMVMVVTLVPWGQYW